MQRTLQQLEETLGEGKYIKHIKAINELLTRVAAANAAADATAGAVADAPAEGEEQEDIGAEATAAQAAAAAGKRQLQFGAAKEIVEIKKKKKTKQ